DMPFMSYKITAEEALRNAVRLVQEGGAEAVKVEGGRPIVATIRRIVEAGIPVMGHVGLLPQSIHALSGYRVQAREAREAAELLEDARALEEAGCFSVVLECVPADLAKKVTESLRIPTIGIGAGVSCDGQVLVLGDLLGLTFTPSAKFVKRYADVGDQIRKAIGAYAEDVRQGEYPGPEHMY
ncbi:3-methyl-2-oxobutanoate hydroxymethyltransferase, partial [bacterium]|nr:3-methyl-2-oxobutanoate hydroxymethyltransferase [bacterium]